MTNSQSSSIAFPPSSRPSWEATRRPVHSKDDSVCISDFIHKSNDTHVALVGKKQIFSIVIHRALMWLSNFSNRESDAAVSTLREGRFPLKLRSYSRKGISRSREGL